MAAAGKAWKMTNIVRKSGPDSARALSRREIFLAAGMTAFATAASAQTPASGSPTSERPPAPRAEFAFEAIVDVGPSMQLGAGPLGQRRMVPILGGTFEGPRIRGKVLPGGADRQLLRADGITRLHAVYELQTDDGAIINVDNRVTVDNPPGQTRYALSTIDLVAPDGPHAWINRSVFVGTLVSLRPQRSAVRVTFYRLTPG
jgi:hypothetical protein